MSRKILHDLRQRVQMHLGIKIWGKVVPLVFLRHNVLGPVYVNGVVTPGCEWDRG